MLGVGKAAADKICYATRHSRSLVSPTAALLPPPRPPHASRCNRVWCIRRRRGVTVGVGCGGCWLGVCHLPLPTPLRRQPQEKMALKHQLRRRQGLPACAAGRSGKIGMSTRMPAACVALRGAAARARAAQISVARRVDLRFPPAPAAAFCCSSSPCVTHHSARGAAGTPATAKYSAARQQRSTPLCAQGRRVRACATYAGGAAPPARCYASTT